MLIKQYYYSFFVAAYSSQFYFSRGEKSKEQDLNKAGVRGIAA